MTTQPEALVTEHGADAQMLMFPDEATYGAGDDLTNGIYLDIVSETLREQRNLINPPAISRSQNLPKKPHLGNRLVPSSTVSVQANMPVLGHFFTAMYGAPTATAGPSIAAAVYQQNGAATSLDDGTAGGTYTGTQFGFYIVEIITAAATDQYRVSSDYGITWGTTTDITAGPDVIGDGITMTWAAITGHAVLERWYIRAHASSSFVWTMSGRDTSPLSYAMERGWPSIATPRYVPIYGFRNTEVSIPLASEWDGAVDFTMLGRQEGTVSGSSQDATPVIYTDEWLGGPNHVIARNGTDAIEVETANIRWTLPSEATRISRRILRNLRYGNAGLTIDMDIAGIAPDWQSDATSNTFIDMMIQIDDFSSTVGTLFMWAPQGIMAPDEATADGDSDTMHSGWQWLGAFESGEGLYGGMLLVIEMDHLTTLYD